ncbi:hypothetical protein IWQ55_004793 [Labrenzia sp. EL_208]|nr:hypothetical protein [Labrenzia sp. EL_132]MBG6231564.1 hypothetical protein [Labrenzia sp. EL_208]
MAAEDRDLPHGVQMAFSDAADLAERLVSEHGIPRNEIGQGFLTAALSQLRKSVGERETAKLLYEAADDYATRD